MTKCARCLTVQFGQMAADWTIPPVSAGSDFPICEVTSTTESGRASSECRTPNFESGGAMRSAATTPTPPSASSQTETPGPGTPGPGPTAGLTVHEVARDQYWCLVIKHSVRA